MQSFYRIKKSPHVKTCVIIHTLSKSRVLHTTVDFSDSQESKKAKAGGYGYNKYEYNLNKLFPHGNKQVFEDRIYAELEEQGYVVFVYYNYK